MIEDLGIPAAGNDRRYWRRHQKRRVRKARRSWTALRAAGAVFLDLALLGVFGYVGYETFGHVTTAPQFALRDIEVEGAARLSPEDVRRALAPFAGRNLLEVDLEEAAAAVASDPWVARASLMRVLPRSLKVEIEERKPAALAVVRGTVHVVGDDGFDIGPAAAGFSLDRPLLTGLDRLDRGARERALAAGSAAIASLAAASPELAAEVSEIDLSRPDRLRLVPKTRGPEILLDPGRIDGNLEDYLSLRGEIESRWGETSRVDLRWRDRISILPAAAGPGPESD